MPVIHELDSHMSDLIAAGEVVERPSSVCKELIENSIDAGATQITVEIEHGGISYLRICNKGKYCIYSLLVFIDRHNLMVHFIKFYSNMSSKSSETYK